MHQTNLHELVFNYYTNLYFSQCANVLASDYLSSGDTLKMFYNAKSV